jgi:two-component system sensor histidine kinase KdpD
LLAVINEECDRMNHLVEEATRMARLESYQVELEWTPYNIGEAIDRALEMAKRSLGGHKIEMHAADSVPPVPFDMELIVSVLMQFLENAARYSPPEWPIHISVENGEGKLTVSVADRGPGIDDLEQALIFDKFYRGKDNRYAVQGTGMGLAIAKAVIEAHGGTIGVTSQTGQGSVFWFSLPATAQG